MKRITLIVRQTEINKLFPDGLHLQLEDNASVFDAIKAFDGEMLRRHGQFPVKTFACLFQMVYHPYENRFYKQVAIQASAKTEKFLNVRENPNMILPDATTIVLIPQGGCSTDWEEPVK